MAERPHPYPERQYHAHAFVAAELHSAAQRLWIQGPRPGTYRYDLSAAGLELAATLPEPQTIHEAQEGPRLTVAIRNPSHRLRSALKRALDDNYRYGDQVVFAVLDPQEAAFARHPGVRCCIFDRYAQSGHDQEHTTPTYDGDLTYEGFETLAEQGGICEKASPSQRLGRWVLSGIDTWLQAEEQIGQGGGRRGQGMFSPW
jgi:hypothetical protein